jgi:hypothetical protein
MDLGKGGDGAVNIFCEHDSVKKDNPLRAIVMTLILLALTLGLPNCLAFSEVYNGDFETCDFSGWTYNDTYLDASNSSIVPHSNVTHTCSYQLVLNDTGIGGTSAFISQSIDISGADTIQLVYWSNLRYPSGELMRLNLENETNGRTCYQAVFDPGTNGAVANRSFSISQFALVNCSSRVQLTIIVEKCNWFHKGLLIQLDDISLARMTTSNPLSAKSGNPFEHYFVWVLLIFILLVIIGYVYVKFRRQKG